MQEQPFGFQDMFMRGQCVWGIISKQGFVMPSKTKKELKPTANIRVKIRVSKGFTDYWLKMIAGMPWVKPPTGWPHFGEKEETLRRDHRWGLKIRENVWNFVCVTHMSEVHCAIFKNCNLIVLATQVQCSHFIWRCKSRQPLQRLFILCVGGGALLALCTRLQNENRTMHSCLCHSRLGFCFEVGPLVHVLWTIAVAAGLTCISPWKSLSIFPLLVSPKKILFKVKHIKCFILKKKKSSPRCFTPFIYLFIVHIF